MKTLVNRISATILVLSLWGAATLIAPAVALAQAAPESPSLKRYPAVWLGYAAMFGLIIVVMAVSLMPSKRSHQD